MILESQNLGWKEGIIIGDLVLVRYDNDFYPKEVKYKKVDDIPVNLIIPAEKHKREMD